MLAGATVYIMAASKSPSHDKHYFILMKECTMERKARGTLFSRSRDNEAATALPGSLWFLSDSELRNLTQSKASYQVTFHSAEQTDYCLYMSELRDITQLSVREFELLLAVTTCKERAAIYKNQEGSLLQYACTLLDQCNSASYGGLTVEISDDTNNSERLKGELKYAGSIPGFVGYWFAIELPMVRCHSQFLLKDFIISYELLAGHCDFLVHNGWFSVVIA
jgi:hypothetical protein